MLKQLARRYSNCSIAIACGVTDTTVRKWLKRAGIRREKEFKRQTGSIPKREMVVIGKRAKRLGNRVAQRKTERMTKERVSRVIALIGEQAAVNVQQADLRTGQRAKFASAHDIRRGCAQRLINAGISAETLKLVLRHRDFATTEKFYGAQRSAQAAAAEILEKLNSPDNNSALVGGLVGESRKLRSYRLRSF